MYITIVLDDNQVVIDGEDLKIPIDKSTIPDWVEVIWWDGNEGMLQHREDNTKSLPIDSFEPYQHILNTFLEKKEYIKKQQEIPMEDRARAMRNDVRKQTDIMFNPGYTIHDELLTEKQKDQLFNYCLDLAKWPKQPNWPEIPLPTAPEWLAPLLNMPEWPPINNELN
ncbi:hypothetical protein [Zooshikella ganghwensis]|uniref:Phage tail protein n=1 Tax=Zooshikella ganghwensis TaxID=202772 RepID=A0A4P9VH19_9GAMM|nr:hypothetical protein [Zooshikella ganghwensis]RDH41510.1 hypothetical protein B9G39_28250 [Zooshikella ganghwensis]